MNRRERLRISDMMGVNVENKATLIFYEKINQHAGETSKRLPPNFKKLDKLVP